MLFRSLVLQRQPWSDAPEAARLAALREGLHDLGLEALPWSQASRELQQRLCLAHHHLGDPWPDRSDPALQADPLSWLGDQLGAVRSRADLQQLNLQEALWSGLPWSARQELEALLPTTVAIPSGRQARLDYSSGSPVLAWDTLQTSTLFDGTPSELHVIVDAATGTVLDQWDGIQTAADDKGYFNGTVDLAHTAISGTLPYRLQDASRGGQLTCDMRDRSAGCYFIDDADGKFGSGALTDRQTIAVDAQYGTAVTWDYYLNVHSRNGIANNGTGAYNRVHYSRKYNNAFWSDSCFCMTYGDGDGTTFNPFDSLDVAEIGRAHV